MFKFSKFLVLGFFDFYFSYVITFYSDFDAAETVSEKMTKVFDVKGVKGFRKLLKEIAVTASTGKHDNELIGSCNIALRVSCNLFAVLYNQRSL